MEGWKKEGVGRGTNGVFLGRRERKRFLGGGEGGRIFFVCGQEGVNVCAGYGTLATAVPEKRTKSLR
jgi:hypothetical protein